MGGEVGERFEKTKQVNNCIIILHRSFEFPRRVFERKKAHCRLLM